MLRKTLAVWFVFVALFSEISDRLALADDRPNIVLINMDDADAELLYRQMNNTNYRNMRQLAHEGLRFTNMHATTPFCAPSRAALFRGQYAFNTGVKVNDQDDRESNGFTGGYTEFLRRGYQQDELGVWLKNAGYRTMHVGKFHHNGFDGQVPPGWDDFRASMGAKYYGGYRFTTRDNPGGQWIQSGGNEYLTNINARDAVELVNAHAHSNQPFFLYVAPLAPHVAESGNPADMVDLDRYLYFAPNQHLLVTPDWDESDVSDKPVHLRFDPIPGYWVDYINEEYESRVKATKSVDDLIGDVMLALNSNGVLDNTYVFVTSDNGYQSGHHRMHAKTDPFQRTTNVPLLVTGPGVSKNKSPNHLLAHIDICPTILELAGVPIPGSVEAKSFKPLLINPDSVPEDAWQEQIMIENWSKKNNLNRLVLGSYAAIRKHHEVFVSWANGSNEYYNLQTDPYQLNNAYGGLTTEQKQAFKNSVRRFRRHPIDPITTVDADFNHFFQSRNIRLVGYTDDDVGTAGTLIAIRSYSTDKFWNGQSWQDDWYGHFAAPENPNQPISQWKFETQLTTETQTGLDYLVFTFLSVDSQGNFPDRSSWLVNKVDGKDPFANFAAGLDETTFGGGVSVHGAAFDGVSFDQARLSIRNTSTGKFWNGHGFQSQWTYVPVNLNESRTQWNYSANLPEGRYVAGIRGFDSRGNWQRTPKIIKFNVK